jgi:hypothetical protein
VSWPTSTRAASSASRGPWYGSRRCAHACVEDDLLGLRADRRGQQVAHPDHVVADREPVRTRAERVDDPGQVPPQADVAAGRHQAVLGETASAGGDIDRVDRRRPHPDAYLPGAGMRDRDVG